MTNTKNRGFTLVEVMVAVFLSTIVLTAVYAVWLRVTRKISKSNARQTLQQQLRNASNFMKKDFAAIKEGTFKAPAAKQSTDGKKVYMEFKRFKETEKGKIAQDSVEKVSYTLENGLLTRKAGGKINILSTGVDSIQLTKGPDAAAAPVDNLLKSARESMLNIEILGKRHIQGSHELMYHAERTSVVMRDEYYKKTNPSYKSNFDIAKLNVADVIKKDPLKILEQGGTLATETLNALNKEQLNGLLKSQNDLMKQANDSLDQVNEDMKGVDTGNNLWDTINIFSKSEGEKVKEMKDNLVDAKTRAVASAAVDALQKYADKKESDFLSKSISGYNSKSQEEKDLYKKAYEMKVQDRTLNGAYELMKKNDPNAEKPELMIERATKTTVDTDDKGATWTDAAGVHHSTNVWTDEEGVEHTANNRDESGDTATAEEAKKLKDAYDSIQLGWMGEFGKETQEVKAYNAAKTLINQGKSKLDIIDLRDRSNKNIKTIKEVMASK